MDKQKQKALLILRRILLDYQDRASCGKRYWETIEALKYAVEILEGK